MRQEDISYQLFPPDTHQIISAEKSMATYKYHFIAVLDGVHPDILMHLCCRINNQSIMTLNMMTQSRMNPKLSTHAH